LRTLLAISSILVLSVGASASVYEIHIDFDPPNRLFYTAAEPYVPLDAYVCLSGLVDGLTTVSFRLTDLEQEYPGLFAPPAFANLLPGGMGIGDWRTGITLASTECMTDYMVCAARLTVIPLASEPFCINILDHPDYPKWVVDCAEPFGEVHYYCVRYQGHVNGSGCVPADCPDSPPPSPVESATWGAVKALFR
jgi:hypothetical protein